MSGFSGKNVNAMFVNGDSTFSPKARIRLNVVPIVLNIMGPWFLFGFMMTVSCFRPRHDYERLVGSRREDR